MKFETYCMLTIFGTTTMFAALILDNGWLGLFGFMLYLSTSIAVFVQDDPK